MSELICQILEPGRYEEWDKFVAGSPQGTLFHKSYWLKASMQKFRIYVCFKGGDLVAGLPVFCGSKLGFRVAYHSPLTPYLGGIFKENESKYVTRTSSEKRMSRVIAKRMKEDFDFIHFSFSPYLTDLQPFIWEGYSSSVGYTYSLKLDNLGDIWNGMDSAKRNHIRKAEKDGIRVESNSDFGQLLALVEKTFERQGKKAEFKSYALRYDEILEQKDQCKSFLSRNREGQAIAAVYIVWDEKRSYQLLAGYDSVRSHSGASALAIWEAIKFTKEELGLNEYDFEGSMIQAVEEFFRGFGGILTSYYTVTWMKPSAKAVWHIKKLIELGLSAFRLRLPRSYQ